MPKLVVSTSADIICVAKVDLLISVDMNVVQATSGRHIEIN